MAADPSVGTARSSRCSADRGGGLIEPPRPAAIPTVVGITVLATTVLATTVFATRD
ncbi:MAG: hypothetical protein AABZ33_04570 [Chloroflexota bacterium]